MKMMNYLKADFQRVLYSKSFYVCIILTTAVILLCVLPEGVNIESSLYYLMSVRHGVGAFFPVLSIVSLIPFGMCYRDDVGSGYFNMVIPRGKVSYYAWSKVITTFLCSQICVVMGYFLALLILAIPYPMILGYEREMLEADIMAGEINPYTRLLVSDMPLMYFATSVMTEALGFGFLAVCTLLCSSKIKNTMLLFSIPMMLYYGSVILLGYGKWPSCFFWYHVMNSGGFIRNMFPDTVKCMCGVCLYFCVLSAFFGFIFVRVLKKERKV